MENVQKDIDDLINKRDMNSSRQSKREVYGWSKTAEDYDADNEISRQLIRDYEDQILIAQKDIEHNPKDEELVRTAKNKIAELRKQILSEEIIQAENT